MPELAGFGLTSTAGFLGAGALDTADTAERVLLDLMLPLDNAGVSPN